MNNQKNLTKGKSGITLIALVITIIVLLLLAGVSISMLTGDNGILTRSAEAKTLTNEAQLQEDLALAIHQMSLGYYSGYASRKFSRLYNEQCEQIKTSIWSE